MANIRLGNLLWKDNTLPNSVSNPVNTKDVNSDAIKNKVDTLATETKLEQVRTLLAGVATEDKLEQARALLQTISGKDFATQTTLAQVKSELELVKAELQAIKANQLSGDQKVQLSGTIELIRVVSFNKDTGYAGAGQVTYLGQTPAKTMLEINPIDLRQYSEVSYYFLNYTDTEVTFMAIGVWELGVNPVLNGKTVGAVTGPVKIASGALKPISKDEFPLLKEKLIGIYFEVAPTGDITNPGAVGVRLVGKKI